MTILPGQPIAPPDAPAPAPAPPRRSRAPREPREPREPRTANTRNRTIAAVVAGAVALGAGGAWFVSRSSGGSTPAAPVTHRKPMATSDKLPAPHTRAAAMKAATRVFAALPAQLPGWTVVGKPTFETGGSSDPLSRSVDRCFTGVGSKGIGVDSPDVFRRTATPTYMGVSAMLGFVPSPARAAADIAVLARSSTQKCVAKLVVGRKMAMGAGASLTFTSMRPVKVPGRVVAWQLDGQIESNVIGMQPARSVMLATSTGATEILAFSTGLGAALPLSADVRMVNALVAQTHRVIA